MQIGLYHHRILIYSVWRIVSEDSCMLENEGDIQPTADFVAHVTIIDCQAFQMNLAHCARYPGML